MKVIKSKRTNDTVQLEIEVSHEGIQAKSHAAFKRVSKNASLAGFRKGKIPRNIFEKNFGNDHIMQEAVNDAVNDAYKQALEELELKIIDFPKDVDIDSYKANKPLRFRCHVDVEPEVKLKKYKGLSIKFSEKIADEAAIKMEMDTRIAMYSTYEPVERESKHEDIVRFNSIATINGEPFKLWTRDNQATRLGAGNYGDVFDTNLTNLKRNDTTQFSIDYPDDFNPAEVAGKTVSFDITVCDIREKVLPELTDKLAKKIEASCETVDQLRTYINDDLTKQYETENKQKKEALVLEALIAENPLDVPNALIEHESNHSIAQFEQTIAQQGLTLEKYCDITKKSVDDMKEELKESSTISVKTRMLLAAVVKKEKLVISDDELQKEITSWNHDTLKTIDDVKNTKGYSIETLKKTLLDQNVREFIVSSAKIKKG